MLHSNPELHEEILDWTRKELGEILKNSQQAIYIYVCDRHKTCNEMFSSMLGCGSPEEWSESEDALSDVIEEDQHILVSAYKNAVEKAIGSSIQIRWKNRKTSNLIKTNVILVPLSYKGELFALHFITKI